MAKGDSTIPLLRTPPALPRGPRAYRERKDKGFKGGAGVPPPAWGGASSYEWMIYRALASITGFPEDPTMPPFVGMPGVWVYQKAFDQGRRAPGGSVIDFVVYGGFGGTAISTAFRIQTEYFHIYADSEKHAYDQVQKGRLSEFFRVVDLYDHEFAWDITNQAAVILLKRALSGETFMDPIQGGTAERVQANKNVG